MELKRVIKVTGNDLEMDVLSRKKPFTQYSTNIDNFYNAQMPINIQYDNLHSHSSIRLFLI